MKMTRRQFVGGTVTGIAGSMLTSCTQNSFLKTQSRPTPNVLLLKTDSHNPRISGPYGHPFVVTPNMNRLAARGTVYENSYCNSPLCLPSRASFMAGKYPFEIQSYNNSNVFSADYPTHGKILSKHGIHTVLIGKVDVYNHSSKLGFDEVILPKDRVSPGDMNISRNPLCIRPKADELRNNYGTSLPGYGDEAKNFVNDDKKIAAAIDWLGKTGASLDKPWYMEISLYAPHYPFLATQELWEYYKDHADLPRYGFDNQTARHPYLQDLRKHFQFDTFTEDNARNLRRGYYGSVTLIDHQLGRILDALEAKGQLDNTVVIFTSDHGEMLGKFGLWWKAALIEDSVTVPLIIAGPGFDKNSRVRACVDQLDVQATLFDVFHVKMPKDRQGTSLLDRKDDYEDTTVFAEYQGHGVRGSSFMVRKGDFKYIWYYGAPAQLFNLAQDPDELNNLAETMPDKVSQMDALLRHYCDPELQQQKAEAYIQQQLAAGAK